MHLAATERITNGQSQNLDVAKCQDDHGCPNACNYLFYSDQGYQHDKAFHSKELGYLSQHTLAQQTADYAATIPTFPPLKLLPIPKCTTGPVVLDPVIIFNRFLRASPTLSSPRADFSSTHAIFSMR